MKIRIGRKSCLLKAAKEGNWERFFELAKLGKRSIKERDLQMKTVLHYLLSRRVLESKIVDKLMEEVDDVNLAFEASCFGGKQKIVETLLENGVCDWNRGDQIQRFEFLLFESQIKTE